MSDRTTARKADRETKHPHRASAAATVQQPIILIAVSCARNQMASVGSSGCLGVPDSLALSFSAILRNPFAQRAITSCFSTLRSSSSAAIISVAVGM
ncbi:MAG: hypothetical protein KTR27_19810 [Leptolyngbyaceae cyanobacterium MAG.088]|nr:hypothetical protein [Leptolyngbyaceae cyanobacterium MAG.088]